MATAAQVEVLYVLGQYTYPIPSAAIARRRWPDHPGLEVNHRRWWSAVRSQGKTLNAMHDADLVWCSYNDVNQPLWSITALGREVLAREVPHA